MNADPGAVRRRRTAGFGAVAVAVALLTSSCAAGRVAQTIRQRPTIAGANADIGPISIRDLTVEAPTGDSYPKGSALRLVGVFVDNGPTGDRLTDISSPSFTSWGAFGSVSAGNQVVAAASASALGSATPASTLGSATPASTLGSATPASTLGSATPGASSSGSVSGGGSSAVTAPVSAPSATSASLPQGSRTVSIPGNSRTSFGVPDATGSLLALTTTSTIYPGTQVTMTLTFARAGTITVRVPVNITSDPSQSILPAPGSSGAGD